MSVTKNIVWIDNVKTISMVAVYILHSEQFLNYEGISHGYWLTPFYVNAFFFVSGYLLFMKFNPKKDYSNNDIIKHIKKIIAVIFWPTLVFSSIIYVPKMFFHNTGLSLHQYFYDVFGGISFWFTSSLFVAQLILCTLLFFKIKNIFYYFLIALLFFMTIVIFKNYVNTSLDV